MARRGVQEAVTWTDGADGEGECREACERRFAGGPTHCTLNMHAAGGTVKLRGRFVTKFCLEPGLVLGLY
jgi:hypothetical protein